MDNDTMQKLARFKIMARRLGGFNVDIFRMAQETGYARDMLQRAQEVESDNLILLAIELYEALGLLDEPKAKAAAPREPAPPMEEVGDGGGRYVFGARG